MNRWGRPTLVTALAGLLAVSSVIWAYAGSARDGNGSGLVGDAPARPVPALSVVGLGDSVTAGTACDCEDFVHLYADHLATRLGRPAGAENDGVPGLTSQGLADQLSSQSDVQDDVRQARVVLLLVGANDLSSLLPEWVAGQCDATCGTAQLPGLQRNIEKSIAEVRVLRGGQPTQIVVMTYWNVFIDGQVGADRYGKSYLSWSDHLTQTVNAAICAAATGPATYCVDLYSPFKGAGDADATPLLADDGDHPNAAGHQRIAQALSDQVPLP